MRWRNRNKTLRQIIIDLTPLLDVVFILLIVVLSDQDNYRMQAEAKHDEVLQLEQTLKTENATLQDQLDTYEQEQNYVNVVSIHADPLESNRKRRILSVRVNNDEPKTWELDPGREEQVWQKCKEYVEKILSGRTELYTIIKVDNATMLYRDYETIRNSFYESLDIPYKLLTDCMEIDDE